MIPRTNSRSSLRTCLASSCEVATSSWAASGSLFSFSFAMPRLIASETNRCCAPSCRSRSIRRRSSTIASITSERVLVSTSTRSSSSSVSGAAEHPAGERDVTAGNPDHDHAGGDQQAETDCGQEQRFRQSIDLPTAAGVAVAEHGRPAGGFVIERGRNQPDRAGEQHRGDHELGHADRKQEDVVDQIAPDRAVRDHHPDLLEDSGIGSRFVVRLDGLTKKEADSESFELRGADPEENGADQDRHAEKVTASPTPSGISVTMTTNRASP